MHIHIHIHIHIHYRERARRACGCVEKQGSEKVSAVRWKILAEALKMA